MNNQLLQSYQAVKGGSSLTLDASFEAPGPNGMSCLVSSVGAYIIGTHVTQVVLLCLNSGIAPRRDTTKKGSSGRVFKTRLYVKKTWL